MARKNLTEEEWGLEDLQEQQEQEEFERRWKANEEKYKQLEREKKKEEERVEKLAKTTTTAKDATRLEKEAEKIEHLSAVDLWERVFSQVSFCNEVSIRCLFHVYFGQMVRDKKIWLQGSSYLDWREHFNLIQNTGTGKGKMANLFTEITLGLQKPNGQHCQVEKLGRLSVPALINTAIVGKNGKPKIDNDTGRMKMKDGVLAETDFVVLEESRQLLKPGKDNEEIQEIFMTVCEPYGSSSNVYNKRLMEYTHPVETRSPTSWIGTTRPLGKIKDVLTISGLLQRTLFYPREVDNATRAEMNKRAALAIASKKKREEFDREKKEMLAECQRAAKFAEENDITISRDKEDVIASFIYEKQKWFMDDIVKTISDAYIKEIMNGFVSRYRDHLVVIAHHSAAMRYSCDVEKVDVEYAFRLLKELYLALKLWVETKVERDISEVKEQQGIAEMVQTYIAANEGCRYKELVRYVAKRRRATYQASSYHVRRLTEGQHRLIAIKDKRVYLA